MQSRVIARNGRKRTRFLVWFVAENTDVNILLLLYELETFLFGE
jgi:hypothetical protein